MPGVRDKIIINGGRDKGNHAAIKSRLKVLKRLTKEIQKLGKLADAQPVKDAMKKSCLVYNAAQDAYCADLDHFIDQCDEIIDRAEGLIP